MSEKKTYYVHVPIVMEIVITVEAESKETAKESIWSTDFGFDVVGEDADRVEIAEWDMHTHVTQGNVYSGCINDIRVEEG